MTIECKDLEWEDYAHLTNYYSGKGIDGYYTVAWVAGKGWVVNDCNVDTGESGKVGVYDSVESAMEAANEHNKQQFQQIIEEWRKG